MHEIISINVGQAGVQLSNAAWELFCIEHGIQANGLLRENLRDDDSLAFQTFFQEVPAGQYVPRAISIDLEPTVLDEVRTGAYRNLWHPDQLISGSEDAANNYARGHFTLGKHLIDTTVERIRKAVDMCDMLQGFFVINSFGGGTGSGFAALIIERVGVEYTKRSKFQVGIVPCTNLATAVVEPYNSLLSLNASTEHSEICNLIDNESVYTKCTKLLDIIRPTYNNLNRVLAQVFSSLTVSLRYESFLNADFDQITTNLVPFPRIHYPVCNYAPVVSSRRAEHEQLSTSELTRTIFEERSSMISVKLSEGKYMSCCLQYRGDVTPKEVNSAIFEIKRRTDVKFVEWCPTGFKLGINCQPPTAVPGSEIAQTSRSVLMLTNTTAVSQVWQGIGRKFDILFSKRSFVHWYVGEGMEEGEFNEARDEMNSLIQDYEEISKEDDDEEDEENINLTAPPPPPAATAEEAEDQPPAPADEDGAEEAPAGAAQSEVEDQTVEAEDNVEEEEEDAEDEDAEDVEDNEDEDEDEDLEGAEGEEMEIEAEELEDEEEDEENMEYLM